MQLRFLLLTLLVMILGGCATEPAPTFNNIRPAQVATIIIADTSKHTPVYLKASNGHPMTTSEEPGAMPWSDTLFDTCVMVTNQTTIAQLVNALAASDCRPPEAVTFDSILSHQYFLNKKGELIAHVRVICLEATAIVSVGNEKMVDHSGKQYIRTTDWPKLISLYRPDYCHLVYDLMKPACPERIELLQKVYRKRGLSLEDRLFGVGTEK